jgi:hypothetical protein
MTQTKEEFREEQLAQARAQGMTESNAVPESRTPAFSTAPPESQILKRLRKAGELQEEPMDKAAHDRANSDEQARKAAKSSRSEAIMVGAAVEVTDENSPHYQRRGAVVRAVYSDEDAALKSAGLPSQRFLDPEEIEVRFRGGPADGQVQLLKTSQVKSVPANSLPMLTEV